MNYKYLKLGKYGAWSVVHVSRVGDASTLIVWPNNFSRWVSNDLLNFKDCPGAKDEYMRLSSRGF